MNNQLSILINEEELETDGERERESEREIGRVMEREMASRRDRWGVCRGGIQRG